MRTNNIETRDCTDAASRARHDFCLRRQAARGHSTALIADKTWQQSTWLCLLACILLLVAVLWNQALRAEDLVFVQQPPTAEAVVAADEAVANEDDSEIKKANSQKYSGGAPLKTNPELEELMKRAELFASENSFRNATLLWQRVLEKSGDSLYTTDGETYYSLAREVEKRIAKLPADGLRIYRVTADGDAKAARAEAQSAADEDALSKIVDNYFLSTDGDEAAFDLGCLSLDRYDFVGASRLFRKIIEEYPAPTVALDQVYLRLALADAHIGDEESARQAIAEAKKLASPESAEIIAHIQSNIESYSRQALVNSRAGQDWNMPWGNAKRTGTMPAPPANVLDTDLAPVLKIVFPMDSSERGELKTELMGDGLKANDEEPSDLTKAWKENIWMPTNPMLISDGRLLFRTFNDVGAWDYNQLSGKHAWRSLWLNQYVMDSLSQRIQAMRANNRGQGTSTGRPATPEQVFLFGDRIHQSMMIDQGIAYVVEGKNFSRFGSAPKSTDNQNVNIYNAPAPRRSRTNFLTAYDLQTGKLLWHRPAANIAPVKKPTETGEAQPTDIPNIDDVGFLAAPLAYGNLLLCPVSEGGSVWVYALDKSDSGKTVWKSYLCDEPSEACNHWSSVNMAVEGRDAYVVCGTGVVFALDAVSGTVRFAKRYLRDMGKETVVINYNATDKLPNGWSEDLVIPYGNALVVMASDHDRLFAVDRRTGELIWEAPRNPLNSDAPATYCLGVYGDLLYVAGSRVILCFDLAGEGRLRWQMQFDQPSYGRGFVCESGIFIPVADSICHLALEEEKLIKQVGVNLNGDPVGNLYCDGKRIWVIGSNKIYALGSVKQKADDLKEKIEEGDVGSLFERFHLYAGLHDQPSACQDLQRMLQLAAEGKTLYAQILQAIGKSELSRDFPTEILETLAAHLDVIAEDPRALFFQAIAENREMVQRLWRDSQATGNHISESQESQESQHIRTTRQSVNTIGETHRRKIQASLTATRLLHDTTARMELGRSLVKLVDRSDLDLLLHFTEQHESESLAVLAAIAHLQGESASPLLESLLSSAEDQVRLGAALQLARQGNSASLVALVKLLESPDQAVCSLAQHALQTATRQPISFSPTAETETRAAAIAQWQTYLSENSEIQIAPDGVSYLLWNRIIVCVSNSQRVVEYSGLEPHEETWTRKSAGAWAAVGLAGGTRLIALFQNRRVVEMDDQGNEVLIISLGDDEGNPASVQRLENGHTLIALCNSQKRGVIEVDHAGAIVWEYSPEIDCSQIMDARRLENGNTLIALSSINQVVEVDTSGRTLWRVAGLRNPYSAIRLENGNTLIAHFDRGRVTEYSVEGEEIWTHSGLTQPTSIARLPNGNTLIGHVNGILEVNEKHDELWRIKPGNVSSIAVY
jgi:outer membrane protein assembly factor BamB